jgi:hypothetical protein
MGASIDSIWTEAAMARRISSDLLVMLVAALGFTAFGAVTGAAFIVILCGSCLALILIEVVNTLRHRTAQ